MGDRGYNAGGFAYMGTVTCPRCGARRKLGADSIRKGRIACNNKQSCERRRKAGTYLHRLQPNNGRPGNEHAP